MDFTLLSGHSYAMGVISERLFYLGDRYGDGTSIMLSEIAGDGLTLLTQDSMVDPGLVSRAFTDIPTLYDSNMDNPHYQNFVAGFRSR